jgi:hypothetical protein
MALVRLAHRVKDMLAVMAIQQAVVAVAVVVVLSELQL